MRATLVAVLEKDQPVTTLTTDKHVVNFSDAVVTTPDGLRHYAIIVDKLPEGARFAELRDKIPFYVTMCSLCDAYDAANGWPFDFTYPTERYNETEVEVEVEHSFPTCVRCSGA